MFAFLTARGCEVNVLLWRMECSVFIGGTVKQGSSCPSLWCQEVSKEVPVLFYAYKNLAVKALGENAFRFGGGGVALSGRPG